MVWWVAVATHSGDHREWKGAGSLCARYLIQTLNPGQIPEDDDACQAPTIAQVIALTVPKALC